MTEAIALRSQRGCPVPSQDSRESLHLWGSFYEKKINLLEMNSLIHSCHSAWRKTLSFQEISEVVESVSHSKVLLVAARALATNSYYSSAWVWRHVLASLLPLHRLWQHPVGIKSRKRRMLSWIYHHETLSMDLLGTWKISAEYACIKCWATRLPNLMTSENFWYKWAKRNKRRERAILK